MIWKLDGWMLIRNNFPPSQRKECNEETFISNVLTISFNRNTCEGRHSHSEDIPLETVVLQPSEYPEEYIFC